jgi:predicted glycosyltransferase
MFNGARILVAPLDWGLGHSARCVPIIQRLIDHGAVPIIGADGGPLALLRKEFPQLEHMRIPGVDVRYSKSSNQLWSMARQFPAMVRSVHAERALFDRSRHELRLDAVISDQRFGIRSPELPSVLITHQVFPFTPFAQGALRQVNLRHMARFDRCWIMDEPDAPGLAGELSHGRSFPANARYIGAVSRMVPPASPVQGRYVVTAVISGPEPQRTLLEHRLIEQLRDLPGEHLLVLGQPNSDRNERIGNLSIRAHLSGRELTDAMLSAQLILSRSGYTTLMDLAAIGRSALIIPTPGQAEQEYLGALHARTGRFLVQRQGQLNVQAALAEAPASTVQEPRAHAPLLEQALEDLAAMLR